VATKLVGLDIGTTMIRAAEVDLSGRAGATLGTLSKYAEVPLPAGSFIDGEVQDSSSTSAVLKQLWSKGGFSTKDVVVGIGSARTVVREMEVAEMPIDQLRKSLPFQVEEFLPMSTDEALLDFYPTGQADGERGSKLRGVLVAASKHSVSNMILAIESAGLKPQGVDLKAFALTRSLVPGQWMNATVAIVDIGARTTTVAIVENGQPRLIRMLPSGGQEVTDAIAVATQLPQPDAENIKRRFGIAAANESGNKVTADAIVNTSKTLVESVRNTLMYYTGNNAGAVIQHGILTGGGSLMPGLGQYLASACRLPVSFGNGAGTMKVSKRVQSALAGRESLVAVAVGLGMSEVNR